MLDAKEMLNVSVPNTESARRLTIAQTRAGAERTRRYEPFAPGRPILRIGRVVGFGPLNEVGVLRGGSRRVSFFRRRLDAFLDLGLERAAVWDRLFGSLASGACVCEPAFVTYRRVDRRGRGARHWRLRHRNRGCR